MVLTLLAWGLLTDRVGERVVVALGLGGAGLAFVAAATLPPYGVVFALLTLAGMVGASVSAASGRAVMGWFAAEQRGLALGIRQTAVPLGWAVAALALPPIVAAGGLEAGLAALGIGCLVGAAVGVLLLRDPPREVLEVGDPSRPLRDRRLWRLSAGSTLYVMAQVVLTSFLVVYLHDERGFSVAAAAAVLAVVSIVGGALRISLGFLSDRLATRIVPLVAVGVVLTGSIALTALVAGASSWVLVPALAAAGGLSSSWNGLSLHGRGRACGPRTGGRGARLPADGARDRLCDRTGALRRARRGHVVAGRLRTAGRPPAARRAGAAPARPRRAAGTNPRDSRSGRGLTWRRWEGAASAAACASRSSSRSARANVCHCSRCRKHSGSIGLVQGRVARERVPPARRRRADPRPPAGRRRRQGVLLRVRFEPLRRHVARRRGGVRPARRARRRPADPARSTTRSPVGSAVGHAARRRPAALRRRRAGRLQVAPEPVDHPLDAVDAAVGPAHGEEEVELLRVAHHLDRAAERAQDREHDLAVDRAGSAGRPRTGAAAAAPRCGGSARRARAPASARRPPTAPRPPRCGRCRRRRPRRRTRRDGR